MRLGRGAILIELNPKYVDMTARRTRQKAGLLVRARGLEVVK